MSGGYLQVQAPQLRVLPMPATEDIPDRTPDLMAASILATIRRSFAPRLELTSLMNLNGFGPS